MSNHCELGIGATLLPQFPFSEMKERAATLRKVKTKTKHPPRLPKSTTCKGKTKTLQYFGMGFGAVSKVTVPKEL